LRFSIICANWWKGAPTSTAYLETATETNVAYYTRNGFEVIGEFYPLGVRMWRMFANIKGVSR
jgi:hypothetical protein